MLPTVIGLGASFIAPKIMSQFRDQKIKVVHAMPGDCVYNVTVGSTVSLHML